MQRYALAALAVVLMAFNPVPLPKEKPVIPCRDNCAISDTGIALIRDFEGYRPFIYDDAAGLPTIGYGHLLRPGEKFEVPLMPDQADALLRKDLQVAERGVKRNIRPLLYQGQYDALVSFTFNLGEGKLKNSTLLKRVNEEAHHEVPPQFKKWVYAGGKRLNGLFIRRQAEAMLYASGQ